MGGPGSGRYARSTVGPRRNVPAPGDPGGLSRVLLEPWRGRCLAVGDTATADAIASELASRRWQWTNPYDGWPYRMFSTAFSTAYEWGPV